MSGVAAAPLDTGASAPPQVLGLHVSATGGDVHVPRGTDHAMG